jgi:hypothetical protein
MPLENSWLFPGLESIHVIGLAAFVGTLVLDDLRTLGLKIADNRHSKVWVLAGVAVMILTGAAMFLSDTTRYRHNPAFRMKISLLVLALTTHGPLRRFGPRFAAILSLALWTCVVLASRAIADFDA